MNGVHDMGGMHGFGAIAVDDEDQFHANWERLVFAVDKIVRSQGITNIDEKRHAIERMDPAEYLTATYFERWLVALETLLVEKGVVSEAELATAVFEHEPTDPELPLADRESQDENATRVREAFERPAAYDRPEQEPRFEPGDHVFVRNIHPEGHTRCPRYVRQTTGRIESVQGTYVYPDANAHGEEEARPLYTVAFDAEELWGQNAERSDDTIHVDLWEPYLQLAQSDTNE